MNITDASTRFLLSLLVPFLLLMIGVLGKRLIAAQFRWRDFYLGPDFSLAAFAAGLLNLLELLNAKEGADLSGKLVGTMIYQTVTFGIYMLVLVMHQNIEKRDTNRRMMAAIVMGLSANFIGLVPNFAFAWLKLKGWL